MNKLYRVSPRWVLVVSLLAVVFLSGCEKKKTLYHWDAYQPQVYEYFGNMSSAEEQLSALELDLEVARASNTQLPPGYLAHLGLLNAKLGHGDKVREYFEAEKQAFPESAAYMDFLMRNLPQ